MSGNRRDFQLGAVPTVDDVADAAAGRLRLVLEPGGPVETMLARRRRLLETRIERASERIYGINTGFADNRTGDTLGPEDRRTLQANLIRSHAAGLGPPAAREVVRAVLFVRATSLAFGSSGVRPELVRALASLYNADLVPAVPIIGSVGASGDLAPLSHVGLVLMGEGEVLIDGHPAPVTPALLAEHGLDPLTLHEKEGLALNNGTTFITAWLSLAAHRARVLVDAADTALALAMEALGGLRYAFDPAVQALRPHRNVNLVCERVLRLLDGSTLCGPMCGGPGSESFRRDRGDDDVQDDYCLRCAPCGHGAARDALELVEQRLAVELGSVNDNPVMLFEPADDSDPDGDLDGERERLAGVWSAGHFHGGPLALAADHLRLGLCELATIAERRLAKLVDAKRNYGLPNYLVWDANHGRRGLESGFMIAQYAAAAAVNRLKTTAHPFSADSIPTGNNAEDYVSMGANAAAAAWEDARLVTEVLASEILAAGQALLLRQRGRGDDRPAPATRRAVDRLVEADLLPAIDDPPLRPLVQGATAMLIDGSFGSASLLTATD